MEKPHRPAAHPCPNQTRASSAPSNPPHQPRRWIQAKHDLAARPIYHRLADSIEAHLTVVFAALAVARRLEALTGWSLKKFITTARRYRQVTIRAGDRDITAADPIPDELRHALDLIHRRRPDDSAH